MASEFQSICDDLGHATLTVDDAKALIEPAWFLAQQALKDFTSLSILPEAVKTLLTTTADALELNLAIVADKPPTAVLDFYQFKDICHLAQLTFIITEPLSHTPGPLATARALLANASSRVKAHMERAQASGISAGTILVWTGAIGFGLYLVRRFKRKHKET